MILNFINIVALSLLAIQAILNPENRQTAQRTFRALSDTATHPNGTQVEARCAFQLCLDGMCTRDDWLEAIYELAGTQATGFGSTQQNKWVAYISNEI
ncbi:hypothetical protein B0H11DRAFT_1951558, partial [Mycena galericulata]